MIYARYNRLIIAKASFTEGQTYELNKGLSAEKLTVNVKAEEDSKGVLTLGPVILETTESPQYVFEGEITDLQFLDLGFWSKTFTVPITAWRFRAAVASDYNTIQTPTELPGVVDMVAYG